MITEILEWGIAEKEKKDILQPELKTLLPERSPFKYSRAYKDQTKSSK